MTDTFHQRETRAILSLQARAVQAEAHLETLQMRYDALLDLAEVTFGKSRAGILRRALERKRRQANGETTVADRTHTRLANIIADAIDSLHGQDVTRRDYAETAARALIDANAELPFWPAAPAKAD